MKFRDLTADANYWDSVAAQWDRKNPYALWRAYCDSTTADILQSMFPHERVHRLLKADLFDEAFGGGLLSLLDPKARVVVGMDIALNTVELARSKYPEIITLNTDAIKLPFRDASFSVIVSNSTLDDFPSRRFILDGLHEFFRILQPGGILLLTMDNLMNPFVLIRQWISFPVLRRLAIVPYYFGRTFGPARLKAALKDCGFLIGRITPFMHCPRLPAVALSRVLTKYCSVSMQQRFLDLVLLLEKISVYPICLASGHFLAVRAMKSVKSGHSL